MRTRWHWTFGPLDRTQPRPRRRHNLELVLFDPHVWLVGFTVWTYTFPGVYLHLGPACVGYFFDTADSGPLVVATPRPPVVAAAPLEGNGPRLDTPADRSRIVDL